MRTLHFRVGYASMQDIEFVGSELAFLKITFAIACWARVVDAGVVVYAAATSLMRLFNSFVATASGTDNSEWNGHVFSFLFEAIVA